MQRIHPNTGWHRVSMWDRALSCAGSPPPPSLQLKPLNVFQIQPLVRFPAPSCLHAGTEPPMLRCHLDDKETHFLRYFWCWLYSAEASAYTRLRKVFATMSELKVASGLARRTMEGLSFCVDAGARTQKSASLFHAPSFLFH